MNPYQQHNEAGQNKRRKRSRTRQRASDLREFDNPSPANPLMPAERLSIEETPLTPPTSTKTPSTPPPSTKPPTTLPTSTKPPSTPPTNTKPPSAVVSKKPFLFVFTIAGAVLIAIASATFIRVRFNQDYNLVEALLIRSGYVEPSEMPSLTYLDYSLHNLLPTPNSPTPGLLSAVEQTISAFDTMRNKTRQTREVRRVDPILSSDYFTHRIDIAHAALVRLASLQPVVAIPRGPSEVDPFTRCLAGSGGVRGYLVDVRTIVFHAVGIEYSRVGDECGWCSATRRMNHHLNHNTVGQWLRYVVVPQMEIVRFSVMAALDYIERQPIAQVQGHAHVRMLGREFLLCVDALIQDLQVWSGQVVRDQKVNDICLELEEWFLLSPPAARLQALESFWKLERKAG